MRDLQETLWLEIDAEINPQTPVVFIVGAPRTGSTVAYQYLCRHTPSYFANVTNDFFPDSPAVGLCLQAFKGRTDISLVSRFGHSIGLWQPSEGTRIFAHWFGLEQPGQAKARDFRSVHEEQAFLRTLGVMARLFERAPVIKNAWNCFRIEMLAKLLPNSFWIWVRRDIASAAKSDLHARFVTKGSPLIWNACEPANVEDLRLRPYWEQVVENQYAYNTAIEVAFDSLPSNRKTMWIYERHFAKGPPVWDLSESDLRAVDNYADQEKFVEFKHSRVIQDGVKLPPVPEIVMREINVVPAN